MTRAPQPFGTLFEHWLAPLVNADRHVALVGTALLGGAIFCLSVRYAAPRHAVARCRDRVVAAIYEMGIFWGRPRRLFAAQARLLVWGAAWLAALLPAMAVVAVPFGIMYHQLEARWGFEPLAHGSPVVLRVDLGSDCEVTLAPSTGVALTAPPVRAGGVTRFFRIEIAQPGVHDVTLQSEFGAVTKRLVSHPGVPVSVARERGVGHYLEASTEPPLPDALPFERIVLFHEVAAARVFGCPWWVFWTVLTSCFGVLFGRYSGVTA